MTNENDQLLCLSSPGVAIVTAGPGLTNTVTAVKNAQMAESPVVLIGGSPATLLRGRGALQDIDHMSVFKSITKWQANPQTVRDLIPTMREAFRQAQSGTPGPVFVEVPLDTLYQQPVVEKEFLIKGGGNSLGAKLVGSYLKAYSKNLFANAFDENVDVSPLKLDIPIASPGDVKKAAELIRSAKRPLLLLGAQAPIPPIGGEGLARIIESLGIPCYLGSMSRGLLGPSSPLQMRQARKDALKEADVVIMGGIVADFRLGYGSALSPRSKVIAINRDKGQLYKNAKIFWNPSLAIQSDVASFFAALEDELGGKFSAPKEWIDKLRARDTAKEKKDAVKANSPADKYLNPVKVLHELDKVLPDNTYLVADGGDFVATASYIVRPKGPLRWLDPGAFGTLGAASFALGIKAVKPDANVVILYGDGSVGYTMMEFDTMVRHNLPITAIVGNDACWTQIVREQVPLLGSPVACNLNFSDYHLVAQALGGNAMKLDDKDNDRLQQKFTQAFEMTKAGKPTLVNVLIGKTDFREGSVSV